VGWARLMKLLAAPTFAGWGLVVLVLATLLVGLAGIDLHDSTEPREAGVAAGMLQDQDFLLPKLNGQPFLEKPPLSYWMQAASISLFGYNNVSPRLPSVLAALLCLLIVFRHASRLLNSQVAGAMAALLLLTMGSFWLHGREAGQDALLALGVTLCLLSFHHARRSGGKVSGWSGYVLGLAIATTAKGVVGLALPAVTILAFLLVEAFAMEKRLVARHFVTPALLAVVALLPLGVWLCMLYWRHGGSFVSEIIWTNSVGRFAGDYARGSHAEPVYFYVMNLPQVFLPWTAIVVVAIWQLRKRWRTDPDIAFYLCWLVAPFVLLSLSAGKRMSYLLSLYPAAAMIVTCYLWQATVPRADRTLRAITMLQAVIITGVAIALLAALRHLLPPAVLAVAAVAAAGAVFGLWRAAWRARPANFVAMAVVVMCGAYFGYATWVLPDRVNRDSLRRIFDELPRADLKPGAVVLVNPSERVSGAARYYLRGPVHSVATPEALAALWQDRADALALIDARDAGNAGFVVRRQFNHGANTYLIIGRKP